MPIIVDPQTGRERVVTETEHEKLRENVPGDALLTATHSGAASVRLWDCIDQMWTSPIPQEFSHKVYLRKSVLKCSECSFTTSYENGVASHAQQVYQAWKEHEGATIMADGQQQRCTGCNIGFTSYKRIGHRHLERVLIIGPKHVQVEELALRRFSLEPSEPIINRRKLVFDATGPLVNQEERSAEPQKRKRRRRRSRARSNGRGS
jgi:hypothetical protein